MTLVIQRRQKTGKYAPVTMIWNHEITINYMRTIEAYLSEKIEVEINGLQLLENGFRFYAYDLKNAITSVDMIPDWDCPIDIARIIHLLEALIVDRLEEAYPEISISVIL